MIESKPGSKGIIETKLSEYLNSHVVFRKGYTIRKEEKEKAEDEED